MGMLIPVATLEKPTLRMQPHDEAIFVSGDGRRARRLRRAALVASVLAGLWVVGLGIGMLGYGSLPGISLAKGSRAESPVAPGRGCAFCRSPRNGPRASLGAGRGSGNPGLADFEWSGRGQTRADRRGCEEEDLSGRRNPAGFAGRSRESRSANARLGAERLRGASGPGPQGDGHSTAAAESWPPRRPDAARRTASCPARPGEEGSRPTATAAEEGLI